MHHLSRCHGVTPSHRGQCGAAAVMGDILSTMNTGLNNINEVITSPSWSPPSAVYANFNFSTWSLPSFPAVPSGNQVPQIC